MVVRKMPIFHFKNQISQVYGLQNIEETKNVLKFWWLFGQILYHPTFQGYWPPGPLLPLFINFTLWGYREGGPLFPAKWPTSKITNSNPTVFWTIKVHTNNVVKNRNLAFWPNGALVTACICINKWHMFVLWIRYHNNCYCPLLCTAFMIIHCSNYFQSMNIMRSVWSWICLEREFISK